MTRSDPLNAQESSIDAPEAEAGLSASASSATTDVNEIFWNLPRTPVSLPREGPPAMSPRARRRARELRVPLQVLPIPAPGKRITEREVFAAAEALKARPKEISDVVRYPAQREPLSAAELERARAWSYSQHCIPQLTVETLLPCAGVTAALKKSGASSSAEAPELVDLLVRAVAQALCEETFRAFRAIIDGTDRVLRGSIDVSLSLPSLPNDGRVVLKAADRLSLAALVQRRSELSGAGVLIKPVDSTPLMSVVSYAGTSIFSGNERVWPGESAVLAVYDVQPQPILRPGRSLEIQPAWKLALTVDRRLIDRAKAVEFLQFLMRRFEQLHCLL